VEHPEKGMERRALPADEALDQGGRVSDGKEPTLVLDRIAGPEHQVAGRAEARARWRGIEQQSGGALLVDLRQVSALGGAECLVTSCRVAAATAEQRVEARSPCRQGRLLELLSLGPDLALTLGGWRTEHRSRLSKGADGEEEQRDS
jgi:hypothetical protein